MTDNSYEGGEWERPCDVCDGCGACTWCSCPKCGWVPQFEEDSDSGLEGSVFVCEACAAFFGTAAPNICWHRPKVEGDKGKEGGK